MKFRKEIVNFRAWCLFATIQKVKINFANLRVAINNWKRKFEISKEKLWNFERDAYLQVSMQKVKFNFANLWVAIKNWKRKFEISSVMTCA